MAKDVAEYCKCCDTCQRVNNKFTKQRPELHPIPVSDVWKQIGIDLIGDRKRQQVTSLPRTIFSVAEFLSALFCRHGWPEIVLSDRGREFVNEVSKTLFDLTDVEHRISSAYHPQTNGLDERTNQTLVRPLVTQVH